MSLSGCVAKKCDFSEVLYKEVSFELTTEGEDMITGDCDPTEIKALMYCGHKISIKSMKDYCLDQLNSGNSTIKCPGYGCNQLWPFKLCRWAFKPSATEKELLEMDEKISKNYIFKMKTVEHCPSCHGFLDKPEEIKVDKVKCPHCKANGRNDFFCWSCKLPWISSSDQFCGNNNCDKGAKKLLILATCPENIIFNRSTPSIRGCPNCGLLIEYTQHCTQMCCPVCKHYFCFYCLKGAKTKAELKCDPYKSNCDVAVRQTTLPNL